MKQKNVNLYECSKVSFLQNTFQKKNFIFGQVCTTRVLLVFLNLFLFSVYYPIVKNYSKKVVKGEKTCKSSYLLFAKRSTISCI